MARDQQSATQTPSPILKKAIEGGPFGHEPGAANIAEINLQASKLAIGLQLKIDLSRSRGSSEAEKNSTWVMIIKGEKKVLMGEDLPAGELTGNQLIEYLKRIALKLANESGSPDWLAGIEHIAKYHHQSFLSYGAMLPEACFNGIITTILQQAPLILDIEKNNKRIITLSYDHKEKSWFYEVETTIALTNRSIDSADKRKKMWEISKVRHRLQVTADGFKLVSLEYDNPIINQILKNHTSFDALQFILYLTKKIDPEDRNEKILTLLRAQEFPFLQ